MRYATNRPAEVPAIHVVIPDTQIKPGVPTIHLEWVGQYIADQFGETPNVKLIHLGDHWDMPSLSSYDKGKRAMEGRRVKKDLKAGNKAFALFDALVPKQIERHFLFGNHEHRLVRALEDDAQLDGLLSLDDFDTQSWRRHEFLQPINLDGVVYAHYFYNRMTGRAYGGQSMDARLKTIGHSFTMGHQQGLWYGMRSTVTGMHHGLVAGSCYLHDEDYLGPQGNLHWRGIVVKHQVENGTYDPMFVSLDYLSRRYEGKRLNQLAA